jgi:hypothetical protein
MRNANLHPRLQLTFVPRFPCLRRGSSGQHLDANTFAAQDAFQPLSDVALLSINRINLTPAPLAEFGLDLLNKAPLLCIKHTFIKIGRVRDYETFPLTGVRTSRVPE